MQLPEVAENSPAKKEGIFCGVGCESSVPCNQGKGNCLGGGEKESWEVRKKQWREERDLLLSTAESSSFRSGVMCNFVQRNTIVLKDHSKKIRST